MPSEADPPAQLKEWFNEARHRSIARELGAISPRFDEKTFLKLTLDGLAGRSLMQRLNQCALAVNEALPGTFQQKVRVLQKLAPRLGHEFVAVFLGDFVANFGLDDFDFSMEALRFFTVFGSSEFAVRPFIVADQKRALRIMQTWAAHADEKVRRLASEGSRPRLPWGMRLSSLVRDPLPTWTILEALKDDGSLFVRRSVANHLNDITKDHPEFVLQRLEAWDLDQAHSAWIARHACRTLIKRGHPRALKLFGFGKKAEVAATLAASPPRLALGERLTLSATITSTSTRTQRLVIDYVVHYVKARGVSAEKVFKWTEADLPAKATLDLAKAQVIRDFTTRKHHAGRHRVELQINGERMAETVFVLKPAADQR
ncbi:MAG: DNA alkylation repair protein [Prosthecobacter sp.]|jgi:3-methyladenine DNA glycosylase AlkC|uniref:DNA alkylation repair protein n=1 Tax=Prosthecobacter sp. TaxID=1965333 RepID=UPI0019E4321A|nr:DNA alkylation repair protein [Prosthecobacter sp.]MBE2286501.1 DNA alkylation repair protein [Prosthecobacter sp.]